MGTSLDLKCLNPLQDCTNKHQNKTLLYSELHASHSRKHLGAEGSGSSGGYELHQSHHGASSSGKIFCEIGAQPDQGPIGSFIINNGKGYVNQGLTKQKTNEALSGLFALQSQTSK